MPLAFTEEDFLVFIVFKNDLQFLSYCAFWQQTCVLFITFSPIESGICFQKCYY